MLDHTNTKTIAAMTLMTLIFMMVLDAGKIQNNHQQKYRFTASYSIAAIKGELDWLRVIIWIPKTSCNKQIIEELKIEPDPVRIFEVQDNQYAEFMLTNIKSELIIKVEGIAILTSFSLLDPNTPKNKVSLSAMEKRQYLIDEPKIEANNIMIRAIAAGIPGSSDIEVISNIKTSVASRLSYNAIGGKGALRAYYDKMGNCSDYSDLMVALCRARGIPARVINGLYCDNSEKHNWVEAYDDRFGWIPVDPTIDKSEKIGVFPAAYLSFSTNRNDEMLGNHDYCVCRWWTSADFDLNTKYNVLKIDERK